MENTKGFENNVVEATDDEPVRVVVEEKEGFGKKVKNGLSKFVHSTPAKIIGGVGLVALGVVGTILCGALKSDDNDTEDKDVVADVDYTEYVVDDDETKTVEF